MTDQQLIDALIERVQGGAGALVTQARFLNTATIRTLSDLTESVVRSVEDHRDFVAHLAGLLDQSTPERRAAALAALDLPQETR